MVSQDLSRQFHSITLADATVIKNRFNIQNKAFFVPRVVIGNILAQTGCVGIRYYFGLVNGLDAVILVGSKLVNSNLHDDLVDGIIAMSKTNDITKTNPADYTVRKSVAIGYNTSYRGAPGFDGRKGGLLGSDAFSALFEQLDCAGIRVYLGKDAAGIRTTVVQGVNSAGVDLANYVMNHSVPCPNYCGVVAL